MGVRKRRALRRTDFERKDARVKKLDNELHVYKQYYRDHKKEIEATQKKLEHNIKKRLNQADYKKEKERWPAKINFTNGRLVQESFDYYYALVGFPAILVWLRENKMSDNDATLLMLLWYHDMMLWSEVRAWKFFRIRLNGTRLVKMGYVQKINVQGKLRKTKRGYILTPLGRQLMDSFKSFFDEYVKKNRNVSIFNATEKVVKKRTGDKDVVRLEVPATMKKKKEE